VFAEKVKIKKGDLVQVIAGKEMGKKGKVLSVSPNEGKIFVEKTNLVKKHTKNRGHQEPGGIIEKEAGIHISNVMVLCLKCDKAVRVKRKRFEDGKKSRVCVKCGEIVDRN
jgi:large subunit ribosomal protein L24